MVRNLAARRTACGSQGWYRARSHTQGRKAIMDSGSRARAVGNSGRAVIGADRRDGRRTRSRRPHALQFRGPSQRNRLSGWNPGAIGGLCQQAKSDRQYLADTGYARRSCRVGEGCRAVAQCTGLPGLPGRPGDPSAGGITVAAQAGPEDRTAGKSDLVLGSRGAVRPLRHPPAPAICDAVKVPRPVVLPVTLGQPHALSDLAAGLSAAPSTRGGGRG
jgi:hypothetical protein